MLPTALCKGGGGASMGVPLAGLGVAWCLLCFAVVCCCVLCCAFWCDVLLRGAVPFPLWLAVLPWSVLLFAVSLGVTRAALGRVVSCRAVLLGAVLCA